MSTASPVSPKQIADAMYARDYVAQALGIRIEQINHGSATLSMVVRQDMLNGHGSCHGGMMATLCDTAFAYACNSHNAVTVAAGFTIEFLSPAKLGDTLVAMATEQALRGRSGVYDIKLSNQAGDIIALFRGKSARVNGEVVSTASPEPQRSS